MPDIHERILGHEPLGRRPNIRTELKRIRSNPLIPLLDALHFEEFSLVSNDVSRYLDAYEFYYLSMDRFLNAMSIAARYSRGPHWIRKSGGTRRFNKSEKRLADQYRAVAPFLELDLANCLIHTRILLDRTIALSRRFVDLPGRSPSYTSFTEHKKFFKKPSGSFGEHEAYAELIRANTDWFDIPIKLVRDKFVVHAAPKHMRFLGYPGGGFELDLCILIPDGPDSDKPLASTKLVRVNAIRMSLDIQCFLERFCEYGTHTLKSGA